MQISRRELVYQVGQERIRLRTSRNHMLPVTAETPDTNAILDIERGNADKLLIVMPSLDKSSDYLAFLVPTAIVATAIRQDHDRWLASNPNTKGNNRTWYVQFRGENVFWDYLERWNGYRIR